MVLLAVWSSLLSDCAHFSNFELAWASASPMTCMPEKSSNARSASDSPATLTLLSPLLSQFEFTGKPWASWVLLVGTVLLLGLVHLLSSLFAVSRSVGGSGVPGRPSSAFADIVTTTYKTDHDQYCCYVPDSPLCANITSLLCWSLNPQVINAPGFLPMSLPDTTMSSSPIVKAALGVAHQFDYPSDQVQRGVQEFIREMREGLSKDGATLSQIPTYVTSVPNGTEKVSFFFAQFYFVFFFNNAAMSVSHGPFCFLRLVFGYILIQSLLEERSFVFLLSAISLTVHRGCIWQLISVEPIFESVPSSSLATTPSLLLNRKSPFLVI